MTYFGVSTEGVVLGFFSRPPALIGDDGVYGWLSSPSYFSDILARAPVPGLGD